MQHDLDRLEKRWGLAVQTAAFGVWDLQIDEHRVTYSPQWKAMLGYGDDASADSTAVWRERVHPDDRPAMLAALEAHYEGRTESYAMEFRLRAADGTYRWMLSRGRVVERGEDGQARRMVGTLTDIQDRREAEALRLAKERAEAASLAKSEFLSRMSHELRTPLNAVLGFAQLLQPRLGKADVEEQRRYLAHIEQAGWHLLAMVDDVLELSRAERGQLDLASEPVPLAELLQRVCAEQRTLAEARAVRLRLGAVPPDAAVLADAARLRQVLSNVLGNAIRYNRDGGSVTLELAGGAEVWTLTVEDSGVGMSAEQLAHLFEPFNRIGRTSAEAEGVGIGLVLARCLTEAMGGRIEVQSAVGVGSSVTLSLRRAPMVATSPKGPR